MIGGGNIKTTQSKLLILGIVFFVIMSVSGVYATLDSKVISREFSTGAVDIKITSYKINSENKEVRYDEVDKRVSPQEIVSFIPKIENKGEKCYIRAKIFYINNSVNIEDYITGITDDWEKIDGYYYYKKIVEPNEVIKLFDTVRIPKDIYSITSSGKISLSITAEAMQEKGFEPDYEKTDPWKGIVPEKNISTEYDIDDSGLENTVEFENKANEDIIIDGKFFENMNHIMPGDIYTSSIELLNETKEKAKYYLRLKLQNPSKEDKELLKILKMTVTNEDGEEIFNGNLEDKILLGEYGIGEGDSFEFKIEVPFDLSNKYANITSKSSWVFSVEYKQNEPVPQTGDNIDWAMTMFILSSIGLITTMVLAYKERKKEEH